MDHKFLFASLESKTPNTARKVHIRRVYDILQLSLQRGDLPRARKAWAILARCKEFDWKAMWMLGVHVIDGVQPGQDHDLLDDPNPNRVEFLRSLMLRHPEQREDILRELILRLIKSERHKEALDELELYLPAFPYQDNPVLHIYAGMICLYLAQPADGKPPLNSTSTLLASSFSSSTEPGANLNLQSLRAARVHFERAKSLDPDNPVCQESLEQILSLEQSSRPGMTPDRDSDEEDTEIDDSGGKRSKRSKR